MKKLIYGISLLIVGFTFISTANAITCKETYNRQTFDHVTLWHTTDHHAVCYYWGENSGMDFYMLYDHYEPKDGPWKKDDLFWSCSDSAEDCRFKILE